MASTIKTNNITGFSGGAGAAPITLSGDTATLGSGATIGSAVTGTLGTGVTFPTGHILQVVNNSTTSDITLGTSYTSLISKEITGVLASSQILVIGAGGGDGYTTSTINIDVKITRGASSSDTTVRECDNYANIEGDSHWRPMPLSMSGLDTSPTTGSITYTIWGKKSGGSAFFRSPEIIIFEIAG